MDGLQFTSIDHNPNTLKLFKYLEEPLIIEHGIWLSYLPIFFEIISQISYFDYALIVDTTCPENSLEPSGYLGIAAC